ncbi:hypothetical protein OR571_13255 [Psychrobacillus sp. NEAU-3TGS]|uniref:hypothetical protein n=1 Tax=Psychrobacillus sp. NEAU-3TGS TaxID=2995412 RepID=UPI0024983044|nr:hypothetical protein [Psychrobacillus sp. NEAU-3TGS]MDI2588056.1 hypothetical protein [Psychrobacillus sp. NEAU-3TGS]
MELWKYTQKKVKVLFTDGDTMTGFVRDFVNQEDTENDYDELSFIPEGEPEITIGENEIKSIVVIE